MFGSFGLATAMRQYQLREKLASKFFNDENPLGSAQDGQQGTYLDVDDDRDPSTGSDDASSLWGGISSAAHTLAGIATGSSLDATEAPPDPYQLNRDVFDNNLENLENVWKKDNQRLNKCLKVYDVYGLSPIHLAFRMGRLEYLELFLEKADPKFFYFTTKANKPVNWSVLDEAVVLGNRKFVRSVIEMLAKHQSEIARDSGMMFEKFLQKTKSMYFQVQWKVKTWIPLVSKFLPSDVISVYKKGSKLRIDTGIKVRGNGVKFGSNISLLFNPDRYGSGKVIIIDRANNVYKEEMFDDINTGDDLDKRVNKMLTKPVEGIDVLTDDMVFASVIKRGKFKYEQHGKYGGFRYDWGGVKLVVNKRVEHLSDDAVGEIKEKSRKGRTFSFSESIVKPFVEPEGTFEKYLSRRYQIGREMKIITWEKLLKGSIILDNHFPLTLDSWLDFFKVGSDNEYRRMFQEFQDHMTHSIPLPPGFPVYFEIPVVPTTKFMVKLQDFSWDLPTETNDSQFFRIPTTFEKVEVL